MLGIPFHLFSTYRLNVPWGLLALFCPPDFRESFPSRSKMTRTRQTATSTSSKASQVETPDASAMSTTPSSSPLTTVNVSSSLPSSPPCSFPTLDSALPRGLGFFRARKANVDRFDHVADAMWRTVFRGSEILSWKEARGKGAVNLFVIGRMGRANFEHAVSEYGSDPVYRLELAIERDTVLALRGILDQGPLKGMDDLKYPVLGRTAVFSAKLKALQRTDAPLLDAEQPFPFLFDGRDVCQRQDTILESYPAEQLLENCLLAVETNVSSYSIPSRGGAAARSGYSLALRSAYVVADADPPSLNTTVPSASSLKRQGEPLVSPRKNRKAGEVAMFSDED